MKIACRVQTIILVLLITSEAAVCQFVHQCSFNQMCTCKSEDTRSELTCIRVPFYKLPDFPSEKFTHIDIMSSDLEILENEAFGLAQIESIRLMNNQIMVIGNRAFSSLEAVLRSLDLSYNKLTRFPYKSLYGVTHLDWLNLHGNEISTLTPENEYFNSWSGLRDTLQTLFIGDNDLIDISDNVLFHSQRLTWLNLDLNKISVLTSINVPSSLHTLSYCHNYIVDFPTDVLEKTSDLSRLYLRGNYIRHVPLYKLRKLRRLDKLDLGENQIELIDGNATHVLTLRDLHLDLNHISAIPAYSFKGISVARLYLSRNNIETVDDKAFANVASSLEYLDLEHNHLSDVPMALGILQRLKYLYISSNKISNVSSEVFDVSCNLKAISLSRNYLNRVPKEFLKNCRQISHLNLGYNYIADIRDNDFVDWGENIDTLLLRNNRLSEVPSHVFRSTPKLRELSLSYNKIVGIDDEAFFDVKNYLESLEISFGLFQDEFTGNFLQPLSYLMWLALDNNNINSIKRNAFMPLENLQYLNLDTNAISMLPIGMLSAKSKIRDIRLSNNLLTSLASRTFTNLNDLQNIVLSRNQISHIRTNAFASLPNAINIILAGNRISKIDSAAFVRLPNLSKLDLQHNHLETFSLNVFSNVSNPLMPLSINISNNRLREIIVDTATSPTVYLKHVDLSVNDLVTIPNQFVTFCSNSIKRLILDYNRINKINVDAFKSLALEYLSIRFNAISFVHKKSFVDLPNLQILDLSNNEIEYISSGTFDAKTLRLLNLSNNNLRSLPRDLFVRTILESVDLSNNYLNVVPSMTIGDVGSTLRKLDLSSNLIEHIDSTMFADTPALSNLNLSRNKLNILPDNVFTSLGNLLILDVSSNQLRANFKELFHYVQKLRKLDMSETNLSDMPHLPLPNLIQLRLSSNRIEKLIPAAIENLVQLRRLYLDRNRIRILPTNVWAYLPLLKELDVSNNPIKTLGMENFAKLGRLQTLNIQDLQYVERFDLNTFSQNKVLTHLKVDTRPKLEKSRFHLGSILSTVPSLRSVSVKVWEEQLDEQLLGMFHTKLKEVEITGSYLRWMKKGAFRGVEKSNDLTLRIRHTSVEDFPAGLFDGIQNVAHVTLDLSNNKLASLSPTVLYSNISSWENVGTKLIDGGLVLKDNPLSCDCGLVWLGHWLRRWLREALEIHTLMIEEAQQMENIAREATCFDYKTNKRIPIVDLHPEDLSCQASALSGEGSASHILGNHLLGSTIKSVLVMGLSHFLYALFLNF